MSIYDGVSLTNKEKIERQVSLPDDLTIYEIAKLWSDDRRQQEMYMEAMYKAFEQQELKGKRNNFNNADDGWVICGTTVIYREIDIHKNSFRLWLENEEEVLPKDCEIYYWLDYEKNQEIKNLKYKEKLNPLLSNSENIDYSGLLKLPPVKPDSWVDVIDDMTRDFNSQYGKIPNLIQAWGKLVKSPPIGYEITFKKTKDDEQLEMPGAKPLTLSGFKKRWEKYTQ